MNQLQTLKLCTNLCISIFLHRKFPICKKRKKFPGTILNFQIVLELSEQSILEYSIHSRIIGIIAWSAF